MLNNYNKLLRESIESIMKFDRTIFMTTNLKIFNAQHKFGGKFK